MFNVNIAQKCLIAECWCPVDDLDKIHLALRRGTVGFLLEIQIVPLHSTGAYCKFIEK